MLKDVDIRATLIKKLEKENKDHTYRLLNELAVCDGDARVDIAVANGRLCGYEIKSDKDTLERLSKQVECYSKTFDKVTIIVGKKYLDQIDTKIPEWWGIQVAYLNRYNNVSIRPIRTAKINKEVEPKALLELLWRDEIYNLLKKNGIKGLSGQNWRKLRDIAIKAIPLKTLKDYTRETLKSREGWRIDQ